MTRSRFITFEGIDGAGKSTHLTWANEWLQGQGIRTVLTREPGGTPLGESLRELLLKPERPLHPETEALMMFAARREHIHEVIRPALEQGAWVLCDRFTDASFAYQGGGHGVAVEKLKALEAWTHADLQPDLTLLFDVSVETGKARTSRIKTPDRFESEDAGYFAKVREAYLERMRQSQGRMVKIDGSRAIDDIRKEIGALLTRLWKS